MRILLFDFGEFGSPHLETEAELMQLHLDKGDEVIRYSCIRELPICRVNPDHNLFLCVFCRSRRIAMARLLKPGIQEKSVLCLTSADREAIGKISFRGTSLSELKELVIESFDIGMAVAAVLVDHTKDPDPNLAKHQVFVNEWLSVSLAVFLSTLNILEKNRPDQVYVMNGRWSYHRAVLRACQQSGIDCITHDRGGDLNRYSLWRNQLPHSIRAFNRKVDELWNMAPPEEKEKIGSLYFEEKARGIERQWHSFVVDQKKGLLPSNWDGYRRNVVVFTSSEFELAAVSSEYVFPFYKDQTEGIQRIVESIKEFDLPIKLYIRIHPHLKGVKNEKTDALLAIKSPQVCVIPPEDPISSYAILRASEKVITFGSTMGIEAVYWEKPSIMAGAGIYQEMGGTYNPRSHEELLDLLLAEIPPKPKEAALKYGYYQLRSGTEHIYYKPESPFSGYFKGIPWEKALPLMGKLLLKISRTKFYYILKWLSPLHKKVMRKRIGIRFWNELKDKKEVLQHEASIS